MQIGCQCESKSAILRNKYCGKKILHRPWMMSIRSSKSEKFAHQTRRVCETVLSRSSLICLSRFGKRRVMCRKTRSHRRNCTPPAQFLRVPSLGDRTRRKYPLNTFTVLFLLDNVLLLKCRTNSAPSRTTSFGHLPIAISKPRHCSNGMLYPQLHDA